MAEKKNKENKESLSQNQINAILFLVINLIIPGLGTLIWGKKDKGIMQLVIFLIGFALRGFGFMMGWAMYFWSPLGGIGWILIIVAWVLALLSSIKVLQEAF